MAMGSKLLNRSTLDMWDFGQAAFQFFVHYASIVGLHTALVHYAATALIQFKRRQTSRLQNSEERKLS